MTAFEEPASHAEKGAGAESRKEKKKKALKYVPGTKAAEQKRKLMEHAAPVAEEVAFEREIEEGLTRLKTSDRERRQKALREEPAYVEHMALADVINARTAFHASNIDSGKLTQDNAWQALTELRKSEIQLQEALEEAWKRPAADLELPATEAERQSLLHAQWGVRDIINLVNTRVAEMAGSDPQAYEHALAEAQTKAYRVYENDIGDAKAFLADMRAHRTTPEARERVLSSLEERIGDIESTLENLDRLDLKAAQEPEHLAAHIAATYAFNELQQAVFELREQVLHDRGIDEAMEEAPATERMPATTEEMKGVPNTLRRMETAPPTERMTIVDSPESQIPFWKELLGELTDMKQKLLRGGQFKDKLELMKEELATGYGMGELRLERLHGMDPSQEWVAAEKEVIAETLHLAEDIRHELGRKDAIKNKEVKRSSETYDIMSQELEAYLETQKKALANIRRAQTRLAKTIEEAYGKSPEEFVARGGMGFGNWAKRLLTRLTGGKDAYGEWLALSRKADAISVELEGPLAYRLGEGTAKAAMRRTDAEMERERIRQREAAGEYHEARGRKAPTTEEEFFGGTLEQPEPAFLEQADYAAERALVRASLEKAGLRAEKRGASNARQIAANLGANVAMEFASFDPEEYIDQLGLAAEASVKGSMRKLQKAERVLRSMRDELQKLGIDPETGTETRGSGGRVPRNVKRTGTPRSSGVSGGIEV